MVTTSSLRWNKPYYDRAGGNHLTIGVRVSFHGPLFQSENIKKALDEAVKPTLEYGKQIIKEKTPVKTGLLRSQWFYRTAQRKIFNSTPYSVWIEYGSRFMAPRAMAQKSVPAIGERYQQNLNSAVTRNLT